MNRILASLFLVLSTALGHAQGTMNIYQTNGSILLIDLETIDSVTYLLSPPPPLMRIHQSGGSVLSLAVTEIDSITYSSGGTTGTPQIVTLPPVNLTTTGAQCGGYIASDGGSSVLVRGVCWSTAPLPTLTDNTTSDGPGTGTYTSSITGLSPNTIYYVRAYALNAQGVAYGNLVAFTTPSTGNQPTLTTTPITGITAFSAGSGGTILTDGGETILARGVCWSTSPNPTTANSLVNNGSGVGSFASSLSGLNPGTTYHVRAWATNIYGTGYGNELQFATMDGIPVISTATPTNVGIATAVSGGTISSDGGSAVTAHGVCWSTAPNPTTADASTNDGSGTGSFTSNLTGLQPATAYYVRAYATNSLGTVYGQEVTLTTSELAALNAFYVQPGVCGATIRFTVSSTADLTAVGVCWSTTPGPTVADNVATGEDLGTEYLSSACGEAGTTYYVRPYVSSAEGTAYGNELSFIPTDASYLNPDLVYGSMTDQEGNTYPTIVIGTQEWMAENLRVTSYSNGDAIINATTHAAWNNATDGAWCLHGWHQGPINERGLLYNPYVVMDARNVCPSGWHVPTSGDWNTLMGYLGPDAYNKMASPRFTVQNCQGCASVPGTFGWLGGYSGPANNESGFSAVPSGFRYGSEFDSGEVSFCCGAGQVAWWLQGPTIVGIGINGVGGFVPSTIEGSGLPNLSGSIRCIRD